jgi:hypothetical protein
VPRFSLGCTVTSGRYSRHGDANMILMTHSAPKSSTARRRLHCPKRCACTNLAAYKIDITIARQQSTAMRQESLFWEAVKMNCNGPQCIIHYSVRLKGKQIFLIQHTPLSMELKRITKKNSDDKLRKYNVGYKQEHDYPYMYNPTLIIQYSGASQLQQTSGNRINFCVVTSSLGEPG